MLRLCTTCDGTLWTWANSTCLKLKQRNKSNENCEKENVNELYCFEWAGFWLNGCQVEKLYCWTPVDGEPIKWAYFVWAARGGQNESFDFVWLQRREYWHKNSTKNTRIHVLGALKWVYSNFMVAMEWRKGQSGLVTMILIGDSLSLITL